MANTSQAIWTCLQVVNRVSSALHSTSALGVLRGPQLGRGICAYHFQRFYTTNEVTKKDVEMVPERFYSKVNIKIKGADHTVLESYCRYIITSGKALSINIGGRVALPTRIQKFTVLKSPHVYKKHRVQYEIRTHSRLMQVKKITGTTADIFMEYIQRNLPEGVSMSVYQEQLDSLPSLLVNKEEESSTKVVKKRSKKTSTR